MKKQVVMILFQAPPLPLPLLAELGRPRNHTLRDTPTHSQHSLGTVTCPGQRCHQRLFEQDGNCHLLHFGNG